MTHVLNKLTGVKFEDVKKQLEMDAESHTKQGLHLEHLWRNSDNPNEIYFLFQVDDLHKFKEFVEKTYEEARRGNPNENLPEKLYLVEK